MQREWMLLMHLRRLLQLGLRSGRRWGKAAGNSCHGKPLSSLDFLRGELFFSHCCSPYCSRWRRLCITLITYKRYNVQSLVREYVGPRFVYAPKQNSAHGWKTVVKSTCSIPSCRERTSSLQLESRNLCPLSMPTSLKSHLLYLWALGGIWTRSHVKWDEKRRPRILPIFALYYYYDHDFGHRFAPSRYSTGLWGFAGNTSGCCTVATRPFSFQSLPVKQWTGEKPIPVSISEVQGFCRV